MMKSQTLGHSSQQRINWKRLGCAHRDIKHGENRFSQVGLQGWWGVNHVCPSNWSSWHEKCMTCWITYARRVYQGPKHLLLAHNGSQHTSACQAPAKDKDYKRPAKAIGWSISSDKLGVHASLAISLRSGAWAIQNWRTEEVREQEIQMRGRTLNAAYPSQGAAVCCSGTSYPV